MTRRAVLGAALVTANALVVGSATRAVAEPAGFLDVSRLDVRAGRSWLRLALGHGTAKGEAVPLRLGTSRDETIPVTVTSANGHTTVGAGRDDAAQRASVTVQAAKGQPATVWVVPRKVGSPLVPADRLTVSSSHGDMTVDAWIEPTGGQWGPAGAGGAHLDLGIVAMHAAQLRTGGDSEILMWSLARQRDENGELVEDPRRPGAWLWKFWEMDDVEARVLDVRTLQTRDRPMDADGHSRKTTIFCGGSAHLPDGRLLTAGGHVIPGDASNSTRMYVYDPMRPEGWTELPQRLDPNRWYPTVTALPDGRMLITSGSREVLQRTEVDHSPTGYWNTINNDYEIFDPATGTMVETGPADLVDEQQLLASGQRLATYPGVFVVPETSQSGTVVALVESNRAWLYHYRPGTLGPLARAGRQYPMHTLGSRSYPTYGATVLLPLRPGERRARILVVGGQHESSTDYRSASADQPATATAEVFELDTARSLTDQPGWRQVGPMRHARVLCDATLLADGTVLVSGGAERGWGDWNKDPVLDSELFDPDREAFRPAARATTDRRYHSTALLQRDGTLLKLGSTGGFGDIRDVHGYVWMRPRFDAERYYPPYLWRGPRPSIAGIAADPGPTLRYGQPFTMTATGDSLDANARVAIARLGSTTHGNEMDQRYVWLDVSSATPTGSGWDITATTPPNPAAAPPGDYQLLVVDSAGVPSEGKLVRVSQGQGA